MVRTVTAKSVTRIGVRLNLKAYNRRERFFCAQYQHTCPTMAGLLGASSDAPVSFKAGYANPDNLATISEIGVSYGGSKLEGARTMAITCRMALLKGSAPTASQKAVTVYRTHTYLSRQQARQEAQKLNAVVCAWTPAERVHA
nr:ash family protein [Parendozoicomonas haliclonae]